MAKSFSTRDIEILGYSNPKKKENKSFSDQWDCFDATAVAGLENIDTTFIYLKSSCSIDGAREAAKKLSPGYKVVIVRPASHRMSMSNLTSIFGKDAQFHFHEDLIWSKIESIFSEYVQSLGASIVPEKYYIPPRSDTPDFGDNVAEYLLDYLAGKKHRIQENLLVVSASAGVGKTTLARWLVSALAKRIRKTQVIPVYVESSHWGRLHLESVDELWEIIDNSLRTFSNSIRLTEELFDYALKEGYLVFLFDGFDELCGRKTSNFDPNNVLSRLLDFVSDDSNARMLLTTRTLYWDAEIKAPPSNIHIERVLPFNSQQAKGYFSKYFSKDLTTRSKAAGIYKKLVEGSHMPRDEGGPRAQFVNLPLCVNMIAEYVKQGGTQIKAGGSRQILEQILLAICEREVVRKTLLTRAADQLNGLQEIAISYEISVNPEFELDMLEAVGFDALDISKLIDHPLLRTGTDGRYKFNYDFLAPYLRALYIASVIVNQSKNPSDDLWRLMMSEANGKGFLLEHLISLLEPENVSDISGVSRLVPQNRREAKSFLIHLAQALLDEDPNIVTGKDRANSLFNIIQGDTYSKNNEVLNLYITGPLEKLDLDGATFRSCVFHDVSFKKCKVSDNTKFIDCTFSGNLELEPRDNWDLVISENCTLHFPTNLIWAEMHDQPISSNEEYLKDAMRLALSKFWHNGRLKASIRKEYWKKGTLGHSVYCKPILESMLKVGLVQSIMISNVSEGGLAFNKESIPDLQRFMDNQQLSGQIKEVYDVLINIT